MNGKAKLLDGKGNPVRTSNQTKRNLLYLNLTESSCFLAQVEESCLWQKKLCHLNFDNLVNISKNKRVRGIPSLKKPDMGMWKIVKLGRWERWASKERVIILKKF